ncbi:MAG: hypothetical protein H0V80_05555 [Acidobacteria bacterium]|nr:hypothetical protein [Acidobacteriota bacterium]
MIRGVACPLAFLVVAGTLASAPLSAQTSPPALEPAPAGTRATTASADPRVGLKAGLADAGVAARNLELLANVPKPAGFFDPSAPAGQPNPKVTEDSEKKKEEEEAKPGATPATPPWGGLNFANSDLAFSGTHLFVGNFNGFNIYDISNPSQPTLVTSVACPGGQGDVSVHGTLLFMSVEQTRGRLDCGTGGVEDPVSKDRFRGVRIFDISDVRTPRQVAAVQTCRGSHTHTLVTDPADSSHVFIYGSGTSPTRSGDELAGCSAAEPKDNPETALFSIDVIEVPLAAPQTARIVSRPRIFADEKTGAIAGLWKGGDHGPGTQKTSATNQCHDLTVFPAVGLAAGACSGNGILLDISNPVAPKRIDDVSDANFAYWHSATFNNDGTKVVFTDEWGGGMRPRCQATDQATWGANAIFDIVDRKLKFASYYKLPAPQTAQENCVAHNGSLVPVPGRDLMVQAWYQGGISVMDFTDSAHPKEVAFFDRGPLDATQIITGGYWSAYWYNGFVYGSEMSRGLDVFRFTPSDLLTQNELAAAALIKAPTFNVQRQDRVAWPADPLVARAYVDQLARSGVLSPNRARALGAALSAPSGGNVGSLATDLEADAAAASKVDAARLTALAMVLRKLPTSGG